MAEFFLRNILNSTNNIPLFFCIETDEPKKNDTLIILNVKSYLGKSKTYNKAAGESKTRPKIFFYISHPNQFEY